MTTLWTALQPLAARGPDPSQVKPGWIALIIVLLLGLALVFLSFSFRKQLRKVNFEEQPAAPAKDARAGGSGEADAQASREGTEPARDASPGPQDEGHRAGNGHGSQA